MWGKQLHSVEEPASQLPLPVGVLPVRFFSVTGKVATFSVTGTITGKVTYIIGLFLSQERLGLLKVKTITGKVKTITGKVRTFSVTGKVKTITGKDKTITRKVKTITGKVRTFSITGKGL